MKSLILWRMVSCRLINTHSYGLFEEEKIAVSIFRTFAVREGLLEHVDTTTGDSKLVYNANKSPSVCITLYHRNRLISNYHVLILIQSIKLIFSIIFFSFCGGESKWKWMPALKMPDGKRPKNSKAKLKRTTLQSNLNVSTEQTYWAILPCVMALSSLASGLGNSTLKSTKLLPGLKVSVASWNTKSGKWILNSWLLRYRVTLDSIMASSCSASLCSSDRAFWTPTTESRYLRTFNRRQDVEDTPSSPLVKQSPTTADSSSSPLLIFLELLPIISLSSTWEALQARAKTHSSAGSSIVLTMTVVSTGGSLGRLCEATPPGVGLLLLCH